MDKKTTGIIATIAAAVLCGCPGLFGLCLGALTSAASFFPGAEIDIFGREDPGTALTTGIGLLCGSLVFVAIPIVVGVLTLRNRTEPAVSAIPEEPIPPPS